MKNRIKKIDKLISKYNLEIDKYINEMEGYKFLLLKYEGKDFTNFLSKEFNLIEYSHDYEYLIKLNCLAHYSCKSKIKNDVISLTNQQIKYITKNIDFDSETKFILKYAKNIDLLYKNIFKITDKYDKIHLINIINNTQNTSFLFSNYDEFKYKIKKIVKNKKLLNQYLHEKVIEYYRI